jgi:DNA repair exonuclease SbcCD ATPase subunit
MEDKLNSLTEELDLERKRNIETKREVESITEQLQRSEQRVVEHNTASKVLESQLKELRTENEAAGEKIKQLEAHSIEVASLRNKIPHLEQRAAEADKLEERVQSADSITQSLREELARVQDMLKQRDTVIAQFETNKRKLESADSEEMTSLKKRLQAKEEDADQLAIKYNGLIQENRKLGKKMSTLEAKLTSVTKKLQNSSEPKGASSLPAPALTSLSSVSSLSAKGTSLQPKLSVGGLSANSAATTKRSSMEPTTDKPTSPNKKMRSELNKSTESVPSRVLQEANVPLASTTPGKIMRAPQPKRAIPKEDLEKTKESEENCNVQ